MSRQRQPESFAEHFLQLKSSYDAANSGSKYRRQRAGIQWQGSNADSHYTITQLLRMIEGSRDLDRNNPVIAQGFDRVVDAVHPKLYELEPQTGDAKLNEDLKARFVDWAEDADQCDAQGRRSFCEIARQSLRHTFVDGDPSLLMLEDGSLETLESHRMRGPSSSSAKLHLTAPLGIDVDARNKPTAYYFTKSDFGFGGGVKISDIAKYNARDPEGFRQVLHLFNQRRFSQNRGVPILASVFEMCGFFDDLEFTQLVKAQVSACFAILEEEQPEKSGPALASDAMAVLGTRTNETRSDGTTGINESLSPGMRIKSRNKITGFSPNVPNESFFQHIEHILTLIAINMGLPVQALLLEPKANFSAWRGAESKAREGFKAWQRWLIESLYCDVYRWKVRQWLVDDPALNRAANRQRSKPLIFRHRWRPNGWAYIQPEVEAQAAALRMSTGQSSPSDVHAESNGSGTWADHNKAVMFERAEQIMEALENLARIKAKHPDADVSWRDFPIPTAAGSTVSQAFSESTSENTSTDNTDQSKRKTVGSKA